jgi:hypothetical protein
VRDLRGRLSWAQFITTGASATAIVTSTPSHGILRRASMCRPDYWRHTREFVATRVRAVLQNGCATIACLKLIDLDDALSSLHQVVKVRQTGQSNSL